MKSYKDLPQEVVLNSPDGAMWVRELILYYKYENDEMWCYAKGKWSLCTDHDLCVWFNECNLIPLPNVKIPWEATQDSVSPVPECFNIRVWVDGAKDHQFSLRDARHWRWNIRSGYVNITSYEIVDPDYMREESSELVGSSESVQLVGQSIISDSELLRKLKLLNHIGEQFPIISDCAKAAMVRLVEKWVGK